MIIQVRGKIARYADVSRRIRYLAASLLCLFVLPSPVRGEDNNNPPTGYHRPPDADAKLIALKALGDDLLPLFVLGDLNEDGVVDEKDVDLMRQVIDHRNSDLPPGVSCLAAADVTENGIVDEKDFELVSNWVRSGPITAPALWHQSFLPCDFKQFFIAAQTAVTAGGIINIRFLDAGLTSTNSRVTVPNGNAQIAPADGNGGYDVTVPSKAQVDDLIKVRLELPKRGAFLFTVPVQ
jgi:hypothetical protein